MLRRFRALAFAICGIALAVTVGAQPSPETARQGSATQTLPESLPLKRDAAAAGVPTSWIPAALVVAVIAAAATLGLRRRSLAGWIRSRQGTHATRGGSVMRLTSQALTAQASVHAVRWGDEEILLGCTAHAVTVLARRHLPTPQTERP